MDKEYSWIKYIHSRIKNNKNMIMLLTGPTGSGKSWSALSIAEQLDKDFTIRNVVFKAKDLMYLINHGNLKSGAVIVWDEAGVDLSNRNWQSATNKVLNFLIQTFRHRNIILIFTVPYGDFVDTATRKLFHAELKTVSINKHLKTVLIKPLLLQYNPQLKKWYQKYLKVIIKGTGMIKVKKWRVKKPSKKLIKDYEAAKLRFTNELNLEISKVINRVEAKNKTKELTPLQSKIVDCWSKGIFKVKDIASTLNIDYRNMSRFENWIENKGYSKESYKKTLVSK